jgi:hypothetical protein
MWAAFAASVSCSFPGVRPEGERPALHGSAPAPSEAVYARAKGYYVRNGYTITLDRPNERLVGYSVIGRETASETRAILTFTILRSSATETQYHIESRTERDRPLTPVDPTAPAPSGPGGSLDSWLSCGSARWPGCP